MFCQCVIAAEVKYANGNVDLVQYGRETEALGEVSLISGKLPSNLSSVMMFCGN